MNELLPPQAGDNDQPDFILAYKQTIKSASIIFSDNRVYIVPRWRGPDAQLKEDFNKGWTNIAD